MTDFNYSEYSIEVLENAIKNCDDQIRDIQNKVKRYNKRLALNGGRGYSNIKKDHWKDHIRIAPRWIANLEEEIAGCKAEMASRVAVRECSQKAFQEFFKANGK